MHSASLCVPAPTFIPLWRRSAAMALLLAAAMALLGPSAAHAAPPKTYSKAGVSFQYPANWKVALDEVEKDGAGMRSIDLEGPDDAIINLMFIPFLSGQKIDVLAARAAEHREEMVQRETAQDAADKITATPLTSTPISRRVAGKEIKGVLQRFGYTSEGESVQLQARFYTMDFGGASSVNIMTHSMAQEAKALEAALGLAMDTLRYRAKR